MIKKLIALYEKIVSFFKKKKEDEPEFIPTISIPVGGWHNLHTDIPATSRLYSCKIYDSKFHIDFEKHEWLSLQDFIACFFYETPAGVMGGKYEWIYAGGQPVKLTKNVVEGYNGHVMPVRGTRCWQCWSSVDGLYRTNFVECIWSDGSVSGKSRKVPSPPSTVGTDPLASEERTDL